MPLWLDITLIAFLALALAVYCGWGLCLWLLPEKWRSLVYVISPFAGLFVVDSLTHVASFSGLAGQESFGIVVGVASAINVTAVLRRRSRLRPPNRLEWGIALCALPAFILAVVPLLLVGELLPIGNTNADPILYTSTVEFLQSHSMRDSVPVARAHPTTVPVYGVLNAQERLGFEFYHVYVNVLSGREAYETFAIVAAVGLYLWALAVGFVSGEVLKQRPAVMLGATLIFAVGSLPLWMAYGGYGAQVFSMGLLMMAFAAWAAAIQSGGWREGIMAAIFSAALAGVYSDALPYLITPVVLAAGLALAAMKRPGGWRVAKVLLLSAALSLILNPVGWYRAVARVIRVVGVLRGDTAGNVDWFIDLRQVLGLVPFSQQVDLWFGPAITPWLWLAAALMVGLMVYGFYRLEPAARLAAASFILPHLASLAWFGLGGKPYGYFKAWSMGWFIYSALFAAGLMALFGYEQRRHEHRPAVALLVASVVSLGLLGNSASLAISMKETFACTPAIVQLRSWAAGLSLDEEIFVATGDLSRVSTFWVAHVLREHPTYFDAPLVYTSFGAGSYQGEPWVIRQAGSQTEWNTALWQAEVVEQNGGFQLLAVDLRGGRVFEPPVVEQPLTATLDNQIGLVGYDLGNDPLHPGDTLQLTLYWQALAEVDQAYKVFIHLLDANGRLWGQVDEHPRDWTYFTTFWQPGEYVADEYELVVAADTPPGRYVLRAGLYDEASGQRLTVVQDELPAADGSVTLDDALPIMP